ncbi:kelch-like ECH-associated protein 1 [Watersipora subatra]|uniref:kelch-like ECH-associated protein 1 n=1 Tax=Watersipora subatra TaxID=2589382 RepID=UPI00355B83B4
MSSKPTMYTGMEELDKRQLPSQAGKRKGPPICYRPKQPARETIPSDGTMKFTVMRQVKDSFEKLNLLRQNGQLCDVTLVSGRERFACHRVVLASASPYFNAMYTTGMLECGRSEVELKQISPDILAIILDFIYTAEIKVTEETICQLMPAAMMLQMPHITEACTTFLEHQLDPTNCIGIKSFAHNFNCEALELRAKRFVLKRFSDVRQGVEFLKITCQELMDIISSKEMTVKCESEVYTAVLDWVSHDLDKRSPYLLQLLEHVRLGSIPPEFLKSQLKTCKTLQRVPDKCIEKLNKSFEELEMHISTAVEPPRVPCEKQVIYCIGGYLRVSVKNSEYFNPQEGTWKRVADMPHARSGLAACTIQGLVYAVGGRNNSSENVSEDQSVVDCYNPRTNEWSHLPSMGCARNRVTVAVLDNKLYAAGGSSAGEALPTVECYNPSTRLWKSVSSMSQKRIAAGLVVVNRFLYIVGGDSGTERLNTMEKYFPEEDRWMDCPSMSARRSGAGVCSLGFHIYVAGGFDSTNQLNSVERFDTLSETWETVTPMRYNRSALSLIATNGKLYALGGYGGARFVEVIESYDPATNTWTDISRMQTGRSGQGVTIGPLPDVT